jgi:hypothetical protein
MLLSVTACGGGGGGSSSSSSSSTSTSSTGSSSSSSSGGTDNPVPVANTLAPAGVEKGADEFTLTISGSNFIADSVVRWNGSDRATTFISSSQLQTTISETDIATAAIVPVTIFNPIPGGGLSGALNFTVANPVPELVSLFPVGADAGDGETVINITGNYFVDGSAVQWNGEERETIFVSDTALQVTILETDLTNAGEAGITVVNPTPGGGSSVAHPFTIHEVIPLQTAAPVLYDLKPRSVVLDNGGLDLTITITGENFGANDDDDTRVLLNGVPLTSLVESTALIKATIPAVNLMTEDVLTITVETPANGLGNAGAEGFSEPQPFFVKAAGQQVFFDHFNRPDNPVVGNLWTEKTSYAFSIAANQANSDSAEETLDYREAIVYRPQAEDRLNAEVAVEFIRREQDVFPQIWTPGQDKNVGNDSFPQVHLRVDRDSIADDRRLGSYILFINDHAYETPDTPPEALISVQEVFNGPDHFHCPLLSIPLPYDELVDPNPKDALVIGDRYRLRFRATGIDPVVLTGYVDHYLGNGDWEVIAFGSTVHDATTINPGIIDECDPFDTDAEYVPAPIINAGATGFARFRHPTDFMDNFYWRDIAAP